jgi:hypothetical protein
MPRPVQIRASLSFSRTIPKDLIARCLAVIAGLSGNANFTNLPVDLSMFKAAVDRYAALWAEALDGSRKAIAERDNQEIEIIRMLKLLGHYVEATCKDDVAAFTSSGFVLRSSTRNSAAQPLTQPGIAKIGQGKTGQLAVGVTPIPNAALYEMRHAPAVPGEITTNWTYVTFTSTRPPQLINGLTPGTVYAFQVRAHGKGGQTDWSDPATRMCI